MSAILRQSYLEKIERYLGKDTIIILTGQRRIGKSYILRLFRDKVSKAAIKREKSELASTSEREQARPKVKEAEANVIFIDKEKHEFDDIKTYRDLNAYIDARRDKGKTNFILVDEIQDIEEFEKSVCSYYEEPDVEIVVTGSNSKMLSSDLSTLIGGRYKEIYIQALSYEEFMLFHQLTDSDDTLAKYIQFGGLPGLVKMGLDEQDAREYQQDVYHTVLLKDVIMRNKIRNVPFLENLVRFLADNAGKIVSANSIAKYMKSQGDSVTSSVIINYTKFLCDAYLIHKVNRYDIHGKKLFESNDKFYFEDNGLRNTLAGGSREGDIEKVIENIVYNHLIRLGYEVTVGQLQAGEIDFVCTKPEGQRAYVQASYVIADEATREREFGNLQAIKDNYPKYVISMTPLVSRQDSDGITHLHLRRFLTEGL